MSVETETKEKKKDSKKHKNQTVNDEESSLFRRVAIFDCMLRRCISRFDF